MGVKNPDQKPHDAHSCPVSPMAAVDAHLLLDMMLQACYMRAPVPSKVSLENAGSMVKGTTTEAQFLLNGKRNMGCPAMKAIL